MGLSGDPLTGIIKKAESPFNPRDPAFFCMINGYLNLMHRRY